MSLTRSLQRKLSDTLPYEELLPYEQPAYVHSYVYLFGIATLAAMVLLMVSGFVLNEEFDRTPYSTSSPQEALAEQSTNPK